jgi:hypothetical protein
MSRYGDKHVIARGVILWDGVTRPEQKAVEGTGERYLQYSLKVALVASQPEVQEINAIAIIALNESKWKGSMPPGGIWPIMAIAPSDFEGRLPNHVAFNAKSRRCPQVFDINKQELAPMTYNSMLYPGAVVDVLLSTYAFDKKSKGIAASLDGILIVDATAPRLPVGVQVDAGAAFGGPQGAQGGYTPPPVAPQGYQPPQQPLGTPGYQQPGIPAQPPVYTPPPQVNPAAVQPAPDFLNPPGGQPGMAPPPVAPPTPPPASALAHQMTAAAQYTYDQYRQAGWSDEQLRANGLML